MVGDHTVTFQLITPPPAPAPAAPATVRVLTPEEIATAQRRAAKQQTVLFFSATVLDRRVTELNWTEDGKKYRGFSNIDFEYFRGLGEIEAGDAIYTLMMALESDTAETLAARTREIPQLAQLPIDRPAWLLVEGPAEAGSANATALDAIHTWFGARRAEVIRDYEGREAARAEKERMERENPPVPKKRVISFWRKNSAPRASANEGQQ